MTKKIVVETSGWPAKELLAMAGLKSNVLRYLSTVLLLLVLSYIQYFLILQDERGEQFSYVLGGGLIFYAYRQGIVYLIELLFKTRLHFAAEAIISFVIIEVVNVQIS